MKIATGKNSTILLLIIGIFFSCSDDEEGASSRQLEQYTPDQANWETFASKPFENGGNVSHAPDGVGWISAEDWEAARWDGTVYNPSQMSRQEFAKCLCPSVDRVRGIREVFYKHNPFADVKNPTKAEVDEWHRIAINHVRALVGYTGEAYQVKFGKPWVCRRALPRLQQCPLWGEFCAQWTRPSCLPTSRPRSLWHSPRRRRGI